MPTGATRSAKRAAATRIAAVEDAEAGDDAVVGHGPGHEDRDIAGTQHEEPNWKGLPDRGFRWTGTLGVWFISSGPRKCRE